MKKTLRLNAGRISWTLLTAIIFLPVALLAQEPMPDGIYSGTNYIINKQPKPNKIITQNGKKINDSIRLQIADAHQKAGFPKIYTLSVYPNPAVSEARVIFSTRENGLPYLLSMVSTEGRRIWQQKGSTLNGVNSITINVSNYPTGIYYVQLMIGNSKQVIRLVKVQ